MRDRPDLELAHLTFESVRRLIFGERLPTARAIYERLPKYLALPVFASDAISSSAYATEEILLALVIAGSAGLGCSLWVALAIALLFSIVAISYRQTVLAYPSGGGAYIVARENLGVYSGLVAAAALLTDYVLTVAVSIAAGVAAIVSAFPSFEPHRVALCVLCIALITFANLRGTRESGKLFAGPVYVFIGIVVLMIVLGAFELALSRPSAPAHLPAVPAAQAITLLLLVRAFSSGCAALTGIEAISNGVPSFRPPESRNAATTLLWMTSICIALFLGITALARAYHIVPGPHFQETVLSMVGRSVFGRSFPYFVLQIATGTILILAANTSFAGLPRLLSILARDGFAPRQLANLGDRLVFANGILLLGACSSVVVIIFHGLTHSIIPLYAVGVFASFTLSQAGMVRHWQRLRGEHWQVKATVNALGAFTTGIVLLVVLSAKLLHGAWIVLLIVPALVLTFRKIHSHYQSLTASLALDPSITARPIRHAVLVLIPDLHRGVLPAVRYAKSIAPECEAVFVEIDPKETPKLREAWAAHDLDVPLTILKSPWRSLTEPIIRYARTIRAEKHLDTVTVIIPEVVTTRWWHRLLHNQSGLLLKFALMFEPGVVVINVRYRPTE